jgi:hypothetical protein
VQAAVQLRESRTVTFPSWSKSNRLPGSALDPIAPMMALMSSTSTLRKEEGAHARGYFSTLGSSSVTISPGELNKGFIFNSDPCLVDACASTVSGIPDGGFLIQNDVEGALTREPGSWTIGRAGEIRTRDLLHPKQAR